MSIAWHSNETHEADHLSRQLQWNKTFQLPPPACTNRSRGQDPMYLRQECKSVERVNTWPYSWCLRGASLSVVSVIEKHVWHCLGSHLAAMLCYVNDSSYWLGIGHSVEWLQCGWKTDSLPDLSSTLLGDCFTMLFTMYLENKLGS